MIFFQVVMCGVTASTCKNNYMRLATLYQEARHFDSAIQNFKYATTLAHENPLDKANSLQYLAMLTFNIGHVSVALEYEQNAYKIYKALLGAEAEQTEQCKQVVKRFTEAVVARAKEAREKQAVEDAELVRENLMLEESKMSAARGNGKKTKERKQKKKTSGRKS